MPKYDSQFEYQATLPQTCKVKWTTHGWCVEGAEEEVALVPDVVKLGKTYARGKREWVRGYLRPGTLPGKNAVHSHQLATTKG